MMKTEYFCDLCGARISEHAARHPRIEILVDEARGISRTINIFVGETGFEDVCLDCQTRLVKAIKGAVDALARKKEGKNGTDET